MVPEKIRSQLDQLSTIKDGLQSQLNKGLLSAELEGKKVLKQLGADLDTTDLKVAEVVAAIRENNPSLKDFALNVDAATYDFRYRLNWNARMMSAYAKMQAGKTIEKEIKPKLEGYYQQAESALKEVASQIKGMKVH